MAEISTIDGGVGRGRVGRGRGVVRGSVGSATEAGDRVASATGPAASSGSRAGIRASTGCGQAELGSGNAAMLGSGMNGGGAGGGVALTGVLTMGATAAGPAVTGSSARSVARSVTRSGSSPARTANAAKKSSIWRVNSEIGGKGGSFNRQRRTRRCFHLSGGRNQRGQRHRHDHRTRRHRHCSHRRRSIVSVTVAVRTVHVLF